MKIVIANLVVIGDLSSGPWQYNVTVQVSDQFGNIYTQVVEVTVIPPPATTVAATTAALLTSPFATTTPSPVSTHSKSSSVHLQL